MGKARACLFQDKEGFMRTSAMAAGSTSRRHGVGAPALFVVLLVAVREAGAGTVGPDAFGYRATDASPFAFEDISATGTRTLNGTDDSTFTAPLGFTFIFYGQAFTSASWSPNGLITFGGTNSQFNN